MKRILTSLLTALILITPAAAVAEESEPESYDFDSYTLQVMPVEIPVILLTTEPVEKPKPEPVVYIVVAGDNLTKIGEAHNVEWQRLWAKNTQLKHPDVLDIGDKITIPLPDEVLDRPIPASVSLPKITPGVAHYSGGNTYDYGYCTWYVKNRRGASLPNGLGNANQWYSRAQALGMATGSKPRAGAVGTTTRGSLGHVVYVESVNADGSVNISEMNAPTWGKVTHKTAPASDYLYIY